jgi:hypothetical protein
MFLCEKETVFISTVGVETYSFNVEVISSLVGFAKISF